MTSESILHFAFQARIIKAYYPFSEKRVFKISCANLEKEN